MGIMDLFKAPEPQQEQQQTQQTQQPATEPAKLEGSEQTPVNPLDAYKKMFDNATSGTPNTPPAFKLDPQVLNDVSSKMDFMQGIDAELVQKATSGDVNSLMKVIQSVGQNAYRASLEHTTALTDTYLGERSKFDKGTVAAGVRQQLTQAELASAPNYDHPVLKAELNRVAAQYAKANPDATPQQVAKAAHQYIQDLNAALNPSTGSSGNGQGQGNAGEMDWSKYLSNS